MRHTSRFMAVAAVTTLLLGCVAHPSEVTTTWRDPATVGPVHFRKMVAIFTGGDAELRTRIEDRLARRLPNTVPSHTLLSEDQLADAQQVRSMLTAAGFDGAVVLRLIDVEQQRADGVTRTAESPSEILWEYLHRTPLAAFKPGQQTVITMDARVYSLPDGRLIWQGRSRSFNPVSIGELVDMIVDASIDEVRRQRLI
jgi:hypothetical protein